VLPAAALFEFRDLSLPGRDPHGARALSILGERDIRKWIALVATVGAGMHKPGELVRFALIRARFCELLSHKLSKGMPDGFLMGLLSLMDAILGMTMSELLQKVPLDHVKEALLGHKGKLRTRHDLVVALENADWEACEKLAAELHVRSYRCGGLHRRH